MPPVPHHPDAERALIGALVASRHQAEVVRSMVVVDDFYDPALGNVYAAYMGLLDEGLGTDLVTVASRAQVDRKWLGIIMAESPSSFNAPTYARIVVEDASRRRFIAAADTIGKAAYDQATEYGAILSIAEEVIRRAELPVLGVGGGQNIDEFVGATMADPEWVIDGLISRQDRVILVAGEGHGKSYLLQQVLLCAAAGIHPFGGGAIPPVRVLLIDLENPEAMLRRRLRGLRDQVALLAPETLDPSRVIVEARPQGLDVTHRSDEMWLNDMVNRHRPDILAIGPAYKLHESAEENSSDVRQVVKVLDRIRTRFRCAMMIEAHAPHEAFRKGPNGERPKIRPAGSRTWIRWPEMVIALEPKSENRMDSGGEWMLTNVRPPREPREWPKKLERGTILPWIAVEERDSVWGGVGRG